MYTAVTGTDLCTGRAECICEVRKRNLRSENPRQYERIGKSLSSTGYCSELAEVADVVSISLNAPTKESYMEITRPQFENAFEGMLAFAQECGKQIPKVKMTVVDVLTPEEIEASRKLAESVGVELRVRKYV